MFKPYVSKRVVFGLMPSLFLMSSFIAAQAQLNISPPAKVTAKAQDQIVIPIQLTNPAAQAIDAFGLKFYFPGALLQYDTVQTAGTLTNGWFVVRGLQTGPNEVT